MRFFVATHNPGKLARVRALLSGFAVEVLAPGDLGMPIIEVEEDGDIEENAEKKARAYFGKTDLPILGLDTGLVILGEDLDPARVRRNALGGRDEATLSREEMAALMIAFYREIAERHGGSVDACWEDAFALVMPDGSVKHERDERPMRLTAEVRGVVDPNLPIRSMYTSLITGKYTCEQTVEEQAVEMQPYQAALKRLFGF